MTADDITSLVDQAIIKAAGQRWQLTTDRLAQAEADLRDAKTAHDAAQNASKRAIAGLGDLSPLDAEHQINSAATVLSVAQKVRDAAAAAPEEATEGQETARGEAWKPVYIAGIKRRLAAAKAADAARDLLAQATADYDVATEFLNTATRNGTLHVIYDQSHSKAMGTYGTEVALWSVPNSWWVRQAGLTSPLSQKAITIMTTEEIIAERDTALAALAHEKLGGAFARSKFVSDRLTIPADLAHSAFGRAFKIEGGQVVAYDPAGNKVLSRLRLGEVADFDEALEMLVNEYPNRDRILKASSNSGGGAKNNPWQPKTMQRSAFSEMPPDHRMKWIREGGTVVD